MQLSIPKRWCHSVVWEPRSCPIFDFQIFQNLKKIESGFIFGKIEYVDDIARDEVISISYQDTDLNEGDYLKRTSIIDFKLGNGKQ